MCRLFGFRSNTPGEVHQSLVLEKNSLRVQSQEHKDGWGIAYYQQAAPEVALGLGPAHLDPDFERVSNLVSSHAVIAHVRLASVGAVNLRNAHPFVYRQWTFAHNGTVCDFAQHQQAIESLIAPDFLSLIQGETDSERCFYLFLTHLRALGALDNTTLSQLAHALARTTEQLAELTRTTEAGKAPTATNFLVGDGRLMVCTRRNRSLFFSEGLKRKSPSAHRAPENGTQLQQLVIASEELSSESHWHEVAEDTLVGVDADLRLYRWTLAEMAQPLSATASSQTASSAALRLPVTAA
ncbi:MAG TPA: class II glutamine amidotransferase [Myxococcaceae bacterium]|nr:class II glutamine amidotransferase [Myxococcaceae bacterium]